MGAVPDSFICLCNSFPLWVSLSSLDVMVCAWLVIPFFLDVMESLFISEGRGGRKSRGENQRRGKTWGRGKRRNCNCDVIYDRRVKQKEYFPNYQKSTEYTA